jgi:hypothetical protein
MRKAGRVRPQRIPDLPDKWLLAFGGINPSVRAVGRIKVRNEVQRLQRVSARQSQDAVQWKNLIAVPVDQGYILPAKRTNTYFAISTK